MPLREPREQRERKRGWQPEVKKQKLSSLQTRNNAFFYL